MTFEIDNSGDDPSADVADHWLDEALRAVPLPDGFLTRMRTLADSAECEVAGSRAHSGDLMPSRGRDASTRSPLEWR
jgi:hypothetical protein